ncbi:OLC1v1030769C1 [Oldenlandia corymbosa var. corymbosa]|uniref:OLC1v1030769C1 n=1 Tax=Oldenlandia corymbosa var. corymbosa TaxID=529605 RepID=A0AAV1CGY0_OLDCO|nr:OLC1v1030769C1 [Oldenlandia corymbosa var. corymbosa]
MGLPRFTRPKGGVSACSPNLFVANCGPAVGLSFDVISSVFNEFGEVKGVYPADETGTRVIVCFDCQSSAESAMEALHGRPCPLLGGRCLHIRYSVQSTDTVRARDLVDVSLTDSELKVPGVYLLHDFVTVREEEELLAAVDSRPWHNLAKRRVQHYGYEFCYATRNVNFNKCLGELPSFVSPIVERVSLFQTLGCAEDMSLDQLTVNEYPIGVGLSPHVDTHSAFDGLIFSLSLAGPCIMEFRKYATDDSLSNFTSDCDDEGPDSSGGSNFVRRAIYLPPRSMLLLSGEARYAWHHYIPHHKVDKIQDKVVRRGTRRVSFTLRKVRKGPCECEYPEYCDSQK